MARERQGPIIQNFDVGCKLLGEHLPRVVLSL
jgi:hypothetical protein